MKIRSVLTLVGGLVVVGGCASGPKVDLTAEAKAIRALSAKKVGGAWLVAADMANSDRPLPSGG